MQRRFHLILAVLLLSPVAARATEPVPPVVRVEDRAFVADLSNTRLQFIPKLIGNEVRWARSGFGDPEWTSRKLTWRIRELELAEAALFGRLIRFLVETGTAETLYSVPGETSVRDRLTKEPLTDYEAFRRLLSEQAISKNYLTAAAEIMSVLGAYGMLYWLDVIVTGPSAWGFKLNPEGMRQKFFTSAGYRFDRNDMIYNTPGHPLAGASYHYVGRANGLNTFESFLLSVFASSYWEFIGEIRESVSINDMVMTTTGGVPVGEFAYQLSVFANQTSDDSVPERLMRWTFGKPLQFLGIGIDRPEWRGRDGKRKPKMAHQFRLHS